MSTAIARYGFSLVTSFAVVFCLFWVMQSLIATADRSIDRYEPVRWVDFVRVEHEEPLIKKDRKPKQPLEPQPPPDMPPPVVGNINPTTLGVTGGVAPVEKVIETGPDGLMQAYGDGEYLPLVKVRPVYPRGALTREIEGYVIVQYTVTPQGTVRDVRVVVSQPAGIFDRSAVQAAIKFKYKPRVIDGKPIEVRGVQNKFTFEIED